MKNFHCLSISHQSAALEERSLVACNEQETREFLLLCKDTLAIEELMVISTCNRFEMYFQTNQEQLINELIGLLAAYKWVSPNSLRRKFKYLRGEEAVEHLFTVALGLESKVLGDLQIINQVKRGYQLSHELELAGAFLHRLMHTVFYANKRAVQETPIRDGQASLASAASALTKRFAQDFTQARVLVVGLGEIGIDVVKNLAGTDTQITLMNRTASKAQALAEELQIDWAPLEELATKVAESDVVISAVSVEQPIITQSMTGNTAFQKLLIDLAVPASIDPEIKHDSSIQLYNVDQLGEVLKGTLEKRSEAIPDVMGIIEDSISEFSEWSKGMQFSDALSSFKNTLNEIRKKELARHFKDINSEDAQRFDQLTQSMINQIVKLPAIQLKSACQRGNAENLSHVLQELFSVEQDFVRK